MPHLNDVLLSWHVVVLMKSDGNEVDERAARVNVEQVCVVEPAQASRHERGHRRMPLFFSKRHPLDVFFFVE